MACNYVCDNCGKSEEAFRPKIYNLVPKGWGVAQLQSGELHACSVDCMTKGWIWKIPDRHYGKSDGPWRQNQRKDAQKGEILDFSASEAPANA